MQGAKNVKLKAQSHKPKFKAAGSSFVFRFNLSFFIFRSPFYVASPYMARMCAPRAKMVPRPQGIFGGNLLYGRE
jgi:hypothetical protein